MTKGFGLRGRLLASLGTNVFGKRLANLIKRVQLKFDGKEKILKLDCLENSRHREDKASSRGGENLIIHQTPGKQSGYVVAVCHHAACED